MTHERWELQRRELPKAWAATVPPRHRAFAARAFRTSPPTAHETAELLAALQRQGIATERLTPDAGFGHGRLPTNWLGGVGQYAGVVIVHPADPTMWVVASAGRLALYPAGAGSDPNTALSFHSDEDHDVERCVLALLAAASEEELAVLHRIDAHSRFVDHNPASHLTVRPRNERLRRDPHVTG